jgi:hypothetical protein
MYNPGELALVEEFFFLFTTPNGDETEPVHIAAEIDLAEFRFTEDELRKLRRLAQKLEFALSDEFSRQWEAASVVVEIRPRSR